MAFDSIAAWAAVVAALFLLLWLDLYIFGRRSEPTFREAVAWSLAWLAISLAASLVVLVVRDGNGAVLYTTVYLIERSLSLDNLFVFLLLFAYFGVPAAQRPRLLFWGIVASLALRGVLILAGTAVIQRFHVVLYLLGGTLLALAWWVFKGVEGNVDPDRNLMVRLVRRFYPVTGEFVGSSWFVERGGRRFVTPLFLCLAALVFANVAFAMDSIPAAFAITRDPLLIWMGNVFALLGLPALFVLVERLIARFRYLDQTIAVVLALVGVKLLVGGVVEVGPVVTLVVIAALFAAGIAASLLADRLDPDSDRKREERAAAVRRAHEGEPVQAK